MSKLEIKKVERKLDCPCAHDTTHIIELLTGRISDKNRETLAIRLDECATCRDLLAELSLEFSPATDAAESSRVNQADLQHQLPVSSPEIEAQWAEIKAQWAEIRVQWAEIREARAELEQQKRNN